MTKKTKLLFESDINKIKAFKISSQTEYTNEEVGVIIDDILDIINYCVSVNIEEKTVYTIMEE